MLCRFRIFLCIFMFLPSNFNVAYSFLHVWLLTRTYTFVNHTWWMGISTFPFKKLFNFLNDSLNTNIVFIISKNIKLFHETFRKFFMFWTVWHIHQYNLLWYIKEPGVIIISIWFFLNVINDTIDKSISTVSIKKLLFDFRYLIYRKVGYACCSIQITNGSIPFLPFWDLWWPVDW